MKVLETDFEGLLVIEPKVFDDDRGSFAEVFQVARYREYGIDHAFVQDNLSRSLRGVIRGLHFQKTNPQGKLVTCLQGEVLDVVVDLRLGSVTYCKTFSIILDSVKRKQVWIPPGFAHGFSVLSESADFLYKCTDYYSPEDESGILWSDRDLAIDWQVSYPIVSKKDSELPRLRDITR